MRHRLVALSGCLAALASDAAWAHAFAASYTLPVPFWMYAYGSAAALLVSFVIVGLFAGAPAGGIAGRPAEGAFGREALRAANRLPDQVARALGVFVLLLMIATGLFGTRNVFANFNMTFFWIVFLLGFAYLAAIIGDFYATINPWRVLCDWIGRVWPQAFRARIAYPPWLGYYPALALYMAFIWIELFGHTKPMSLAVVLLVYTAINLAAAALIGKERWFRYGEFFSVFFRIIGKMAPFYRERDAGGTAGALRVRPPFVGLLETRAEHASLVLFVLFMLSSTAFDGFKETLPWVTVFWKHVYPWVDPYVQAASAQPYAVAAQLYHLWQWLWLVLSPFVYLAVYLLFIALVRVCARSERSVGDLALQFALSLVPIAFVYNVTHYFVLLLSQGVQIVKLVSDPFGVGWNLFGTATMKIQPLIIDPGVIWHVQVGLILGGHVVSVYLAHVEALKVFSTSGRAAASQLPMLMLMVFLTAAGLWIMSLPLAGG